MLVEIIRQLLRREDQCGDSIGHLVQHRPQSPVHVDRADQHQFRIGAALPVLDGKQPSRLFVPQLQFIQHVQIVKLDFAQYLPPVGLGAGEMLQLGRSQGDLLEVQPIGGELAVECR